VTQEKLFAAILALFMAVCTAGPLWAKDGLRLITVTGEGIVSTVPDMATIDLGVTHQAKEASVAMAATADAAARILLRLTDLGVASEDMQTSSITLNPVWSNRSSSVSRDARITGFVASESVMVRLRDLDQVGRIMDAVISDGANNFKGLRFSVQDPDPLMNLARQKAVADAIAKAQLLTAAAGVSLGPVQSVTEQGGARPVMMEMSAARAVGMPIAAGEVSINAAVSMVFSIGD